MIVARTTKIAGARYMANRLQVTIRVSNQFTVRKIGKLENQDSIVPLIPLGR